ncbi:MAG: glutamine amidotransferase [Vicinamibacterales bacterium]
MRVAGAVPVWVAVLLASGALLLAWGAYSRLLVPLTRGRRVILVALRATTLLLVVACLLGPARVLPPDAATDPVVPILVDISRSMRLLDAGSRSRIDVAGEIATVGIPAALAGRYAMEIWTFGEQLAPAPTGPDGASLSADASRSDVAGALRAVRERYRDRRVPGIILISDGGDTGAEDAGAVVEDGAAPVFTVGVGATTTTSDLAVLDVSAGEATLAASSIDLTVSAVSRGNPSPFDVRVLENGHPIDVRRVTPAAAGSPVRTVFALSPPRDAVTLYTIELPPGSGEAVLDNNRRSVLIEPPGRRRRVLIVEGAPGFEHAFLQRALAADEGLEVDSVVRKGRDARGAATYFVQAAEARAPQLASGFPSDRAALFTYDALVLANVEATDLSRVQMEMTAAFAGERGGGVLVLGAHSFGPRGLAGTPIDEVLPLELSRRGNSVLRAPGGTGRGRQRHAVTVTSDGVEHPVMRIGANADETARRWGALPPLTGVAELGGPRSGAQILALAQAPDELRPLVAVQRYGQGRSMVFAGEASWRWRMQMPSSDRAYELFWRQAVRWLAAGTPEPVSIAPLTAMVPQEVASLGLDVRDERFNPVPDAKVSMRVRMPGSEEREIATTLVDSRTGRYAGDIRVGQPGVYRIRAEAHRGGVLLGEAERWVLAGGEDLETADPRLNEAVLRRISRASGGQYVAAANVSSLASLLSVREGEPPAQRVEPLWHNAWVFGAVILLLAAEWVLRRRWGMR